MLANRVTALNFWKIMDTDLKGHLQANDFVALLEVELVCNFRQWRLMLMRVIIT
jgi:hypothetical protein